MICSITSIGAPLSGNAACVVPDICIFSNVTSLNEISVVVKQEPGKVSWNFEEIKQVLEDGLEVYRTTDPLQIRWQKI